MSDEEFFEEEIEEESETISEEEVEESRREEEMPLHELARMTDIIDLMRRAIRGEISEEEYKLKISEYTHSKESPREMGKTSSEKKESKKRVSSKKAS